MTKVRSGILGSLALVGALVLGTGGTAHALTNILSGNVCQTFYPPEVTDGQGIYHTTAGVENISSDQGNRLVMCPILRDNTGNTSGMTNLTVRTTAFSGFNAPVSCVAMSLTMYGSVKISVTKTSPKTGSNPLSFGNAINKSDGGSGAYDMECILSYASLVNSIEYGEP